MQPTNAAPFNPLDFKKLSQQEQFEAARTMNQKELIAVAGTGVSLETLLKYQGLSDTEIQKRLKDLNPYLAEFSLINQRDNIKAMAAEKRSHAELYAMLEEQSHASAATQAGHKLGNIANLSHDQQIHALADKPLCFCVENPPPTCRRLPKRAKIFRPQQHPKTPGQHHSTACLNCTKQFIKRIAIRKS